MVDSRKAAVLLLLLTPGVAMAGQFDQPDRWQQIARTDTGSVWYMDRTTLKSDGRVTSAWITMDHSRDKRDPARQSRGLIEIECGAHRFHWVQFFSYRRNGAEIPDRVQPNVITDIAPGSPIDEVWRGLCQRGGY